MVIIQMLLLVTSTAPILIGVLTVVQLTMSMLVFIVESGLYQFVDFPTRGCNLLDVILADDHFIISSDTAGPPFGNSDHLSIKFTLNIESSNGSEVSTV